MRTLEYDSDTPAIHLIDQRRLPAQFEILHLTDLEGVILAIKDMAVRGAPAIGITAAFGMALAGRQSQSATFGEWKRDLEKAAEMLKGARPTAVNLAWAVERILQEIDDSALLDLETARTNLEQFTQSMADEDIEINRRMAQYGAELLDDPSTVIHHCNTGALAAVDYGTALGVVRYAHETGKRLHVLVDETRPRLQGARLTAWELSQYGIRYDIITDNAAGYFLQSGCVDTVLVGADRIAANGDVANKIGTYMLALAAQASSVPFYCVAPRSTFDLGIESGREIPIEERDPQEVLGITMGGGPMAPASATARNPAFDITPHHLISGFVTEHGLIQPPYRKNILNRFRKGSK